MKNRNKSSTGFALPKFFSNFVIKVMIKVWVNMKLNEILKFKEEKKERKIVLKPHQTVHLHARAPRDGTGLYMSGCPSLIFASNSNFKTTLNHSNFLFLLILPIL